MKLKSCKKHWFGVVTLIAYYLRRQSMLSSIEEHMRLRVVASDTVCAPGYLGCKRGEVVRTLMAMLHVRGTAVNREVSKYLPLTRSCE
jgi:hypothetical protein